MTFTELFVCLFVYLFINLFIYSFSYLYIKHVIYSPVKTYCKMNNNYGYYLLLLF